MSHPSKATRPALTKPLAWSLLCAALGGLFTAPARAEEALNFGIISTESTQNLKSEWVPLLADMEKQTGLKVKAFFAPDYAGIIEGMRFNKVQVALYGNKSAMEAVDRANAELFAQSVSMEGHPGYWSHLLVHKDSKLNSVAEPEKKTQLTAIDTQLAQIDTRMAELDKKTVFAK